MRTAAEALLRIDEYITRYSVPPHDANMPNEHHCQYATMVQSIHGQIQKVLPLCNESDRRLAAMTRWLEENKPEVFREGLWDALDASEVEP